MRSSCIQLPGCPDKACELVAESIADEYIRRDPESRLCLSVSGGRGAVFVSGDVRSVADFDVASLVRRTLGSLGVMAEMEPFVSIEQIGPEQAAQFIGSDVPVMVAGYASDETPEMMPKPIMIAKRIAKDLEDKRLHDESWFWLGPDGRVFVGAEGLEVNKVSIRIEHGPKALDEARKEIIEAIKDVASEASIKINELGACESRGLDKRMGSSSIGDVPYGTGLPIFYQAAGLDLRRPEKSGMWLARRAARNLVRRGARAALVQAIYFPGENVPGLVFARDEKGREIGKEVDKRTMSLERVMKEWWRQNLLHDVARWGFTAASGMPWEE